jgi:hypothetical protein
VRDQLKTILASGYSPMTFFTKDFNKYFYMAELVSLVDLSLVRRYRLRRLSQLHGRAGYMRALPVCGLACC